MAFSSRGHVFSRNFDFGTLSVVALPHSSLVLLPRLCLGKRMGDGLPGIGLYRGQEVELTAVWLRAGVAMVAPARLLWTAAVLVAHADPALPKLRAARAPSAGSGEGTDRFGFGSLAPGARVLRTVKTVYL